MLYILDQRLQAQKISGEKCTKVINDIIKTMIASSFVEELFKNQVCSEFKGKGGYYTGGGVMAYFHLFRRAFPSGQ